MSSKQKNTPKNTQGNAILISFAVSAFLVVSSAGAAYIASESSREMATIEKGHASFFAAEAAMEGALFDATVHTYGWNESAPSLPTVDFTNLNNSKATYEVDSRGTLTQVVDLDDDTRLLTIPQQVTPDLGDKKNWLPISFREKRNFAFFTDEITRGRKTVPVGETPTNELSGMLAAVEVQISEEKNKDKPNVDILKGLEQKKADLLAYIGGTYDDDFSETVPDGVTDDDSGKRDYGNGVKTKSPTASVGKENIRSIYMDLLMPVSSFSTDISEDSRPLFVWTVEGVAKYVDGGGVEKEARVQMFSLQGCGDVDDHNFLPYDDPTYSQKAAGVLCTDHFQMGGVAPSGQTEAAVDSYARTAPNVYRIYQDYSAENKEIALRMVNPVGKFQDPVSKEWKVLSIKDFLMGNVRDATGTVESSFTLYEPTLGIQMLREKEKYNPDDPEKKVFPGGNVRVSLRFDSSLDANAIRQNFPMPAETITIKTVGVSDNYKQTMEAEVTPQSLAPMFNYAIFQ